METEEKRAGKQRKGMIFLIVLLLLAACLAGWSLLRGGFRFDSAAEDGSLDGLTKDQIQELMNNKVDEGDAGDLDQQYPGIREWEEQGDAAYRKCSEQQLQHAGAHRDR